MKQKQSHVQRLLLAVGAMLVAASVTACAAGMTGSASVGAEAHASMSAVHMSEIQESQMALSKSSNAEVRGYAQHMVSDHRPLLQEEERLASELGLRAGVSVDGGAINADLGVDASTRAVMMAFPTSRMLVEAHLEAMAAMRDDTGAQFDREYMDRQIASHRQALALASRFEASVRHEQQRALIARERAAIQAHLEHAQRVRASL